MLGNCLGFLEEPTALATKICSTKTAVPNFLKKLLNYSVQLFQKINYFMVFVFRNFPYFSGTVLEHWNTYFKEQFWMDGSINRDGMLFSVTKNRWKMKKQKRVIKVKTVNVLKECLWFKKVFRVPSKKCLYISGDSKKKFSLKLHVPKFQNWSFLIIFSKTYLFSKIFWKNVGRS